MADLSGHTLGRYQVLERLGRGGMADVYRAYQSGLDRYVAIKVMHQHLSEEADFITRFQREAKGVAGLRHPNIVQVFDFDVQDGAYFMVMEYIEGGHTLKEVLTDLSSQGRRLPIRAALDMTVKLADALDYAHQRGMIHRDIKPSNVLIDESQHPVLSDFGIARLVGQTGLTGTGAMIGTPAYMSPEQGRGEQADERSDIYALGIILYEMLTGHPPYDADTPYGVILKHINDPLVPPRKFVEWLPEAAERVVLKCLAKAPEDRYQTAGELRDALHAAIKAVDAETPVSKATPVMGLSSKVTSEIPVQESPQTVAVAGKPPAPAVKAGFPLKRLALVGAALIVIAGIITGILLLAGGGGGDEVSGGQENGESAPDGLVGEEEAEESGDQRALLDLAHQRWGDGYPDEAYELFGQVLERDPENTEAMVSQALINLDRSAYDDAFAGLTRARELAPDDAYVLFGWGLLHQYGEEAYYDAEAAEREFTEAAERCGDTIILCTDALRHLSSIQAWYVGKPEAAIESLSRALEIQPDPRGKSGLLSERADVYFNALNQPEPALADYEEAYNLIGDEPWLLEQAANVAASMGDFERAKGHYERLREEQAGDPRYLIGVGYLQLRMGDLGAAFESANRALEFDPAMPGAHYLLGLALLEQGNPEEARAELEVVYNVNWDEADDYWLYTFPFFAQRWGHDIRYDLARAAHMMDDTDGALGYLDELLAEDPWWALPFMLKGQIQAELGDRAGARETYLKALERTDDPDLRNEIEQRLVELSG